VLAFALSGVVLAACGGGAATSSSTTTPKTTTSTSTPTKSSSSNAAFTTCLKQHGVSGSGFGSGKRPTAGTGGGTAPSSKTLAAIQACASLRPKGSGFGGGFGGGSGASATALAAFKNCMTLHGVTLPKRTAGSAPATNSTLTSTPTYKKAYAACSSLLPAKTTTTTAS